MYEVFKRNHSTLLCHHRLNTEFLVYPPLSSFLSSWFFYNPISSSLPSLSFGLSSLVVLVRLGPRSVACIVIVENKSSSSSPSNSYPSPPSPARHHHRRPTHLNPCPTSSSISPNPQHSPTQTPLSPVNSTPPNPSNFSILLPSSSIARSFSRRCRCRDRSSRASISVACLACCR